MGRVLVTQEESLFSYSYSSWPALGPRMGETQNVFATSDLEPSLPSKETSFKHFGKKDRGELESPFLDGSEPHSPRSEPETRPGLVSLKDNKEPHSQREAVIRPQQAGKIDFKSLHNRPKVLLGDGPWDGLKGSPPSPHNGKGRARDKSRRLGKGQDRGGQQQLYRLTISSARPNPTIGIAYPQQKVTPPKKVEVAQGGPYRFHLNEREVDLQQHQQKKEDLGFARCFPEATSHHLSSYTSPTATPRLSHGAKVQPPLSVPHEAPGANGQLHYLEFQGNGSNWWLPPDKDLPGANSNGLCGSFPETSKPSGLGSLSFHHPSQSPPGTAPFQGEGPAAVYRDLVLANGQGSHGSFPFHPSSRDWRGEEAVLSSNGGLESRDCGLLPLPAPLFLPPQTQGPKLVAFQGRKDHPTTDPPNGAISHSGAMDSNSNTFQENPSFLHHQHPSLHSSSRSTVMVKRQPSSKDPVAGQRLLDSGHAQRRTLATVTLPQTHFQTKAYSEPPASGLSPSSTALETTLPSGVQAHGRLLQPWEGNKRPSHAPTEQGHTAYLSPLGHPLLFGGPSGQHLKKAWPHLHLSPTQTGQSRAERSRKPAGQKASFPLRVPEWDGKKPKSATDYPSSGKEPPVGEGAIMQRQDSAPLHCSSSGTFCFEGGAKEAEPPTFGVLRSKSLFFGLSPAGLPNSSRLPGLPTLVLPPPALGSSPTESPVPSPALHTPNSSTCSSLSSTSSSPSGFEDGATPTFFHPPCHSRGSHTPFHATELLSSGAVSSPLADLPKAPHLSQEPHKQDLLYKTFPVEGHLQMPCLEASKGYLESFEVEPPPPPYSSHHFLANSLSNTSLDQLDVFLTCKQCDHNFSTLSSFLEHRQFCSSHLALLGQARDLAEGRKQPPPQPELPKYVLDRPGLLLPPMEEDGREEHKDDPLRAHPLNGTATNSLQLSASDLEIDDAKLDSLITETLNGLEYQSDNPEIDSSFIDVFADEEFTSVRLANNGMPHKPKENLPSGKKAKHGDLEENVKTLSGFSDPLGGDLDEGRTLGHGHRQKEKEVKWPPLHGEESLEIPRGKRVDPDGQEMEASGQQKGGRRRNSGRSLPHRRQAAKVMSDDASPPGRKLHSPKPSAATGQAKGTKKPRRLRSSTWSKELIHKIVQQKNKLHKLQAKGSQAKALPLPAGHLVSTGKEDSRFGEYEYISESDDERVEYAKRHCPRKVGSRLHGRLRSGFSRRHQGRRGKEKEKEPPAWRLGPRRSVEEEKEVQRAKNKEPGKMEGVMGKTQRRGSQSSTSSSQSSSFSSENNSSSSPNTERADSETERETESRKRFLLSPTGSQALAREWRVVAEKEKVGRNHDHPHETRHVGPTRPQPAGVKTSQRENQSAVSNEDECLLQMEKKPLQHKGPLNHSPSVPFDPKDPEEGGESPGHDGCKSRATLPGRGPSMQGGDWDTRHCPAYQEESMKCHQEELYGPPLVSTQSCSSHGNTRYGKVGVDGLKKPAEFMASIGCVSNSSVDNGMVGKGLTVTSEAAGPFPGCKELTSSCEPLSLFSGATGMEASLCASFYLCPGEMEVSLFKQKTHHTMPFRADSEVDHLSPPPPPPPPPPLTFDSSSVFGELSGDAFDGSLYESVALSKESCLPPFECASPHPLGKMTPYDQQYTSFLHRKDWELVEAVSPVLPEAISQFHHLPEDNLEAKRYPDALDPVPLPNRVDEYSVPFLSSMSEDELEIKRLVTELENQLQTGKVNMEEASEDPSSPPKPHQGRKEDPPPFLPLALDQESDGKGLFLSEAPFEMQDLLPSKACSCENLENEKTTSEVKYGSPQDPWPCSGPFRPLEPTLHMPSASELVLDTSFSPKGDEGKLYDHLNNMEISGDIRFRGIRDEPTRIVAEPCLSSINMGVPSYAEDLMQSPEFLKNLEVPELHGARALPTGADACPGRPPKEKKTLDSAGDLELYGHSLKAEFEHEEADGPEPEGNLPPGSQVSPVSPEEKVFPRSKSAEMPDRATSLRDAPGLLEEKEGGSPTMPQSPTGTGETLHSKAWATGVEAAEHLPAPGGKAANPLEELQMFVARTAKHNEEELLLPCFPVAHTTALAQPEQEKGPAGVFLPGQEVAPSPAGETRRASLATEEPKSAIQVTGPFVEPEKQAEHPRERDSPSGTAQKAFQSPEYHETQHQCQHRRVDGSKESVVNQLQDGISTECSLLPTCSSSRATTSPREEGSPIDQVMGESTEGQEQAALPLENGTKCPLSHEPLEKDPQGNALTATGHACIQHHGSWGGAGLEGQALVEEEAQLRDRNGDHVGQLEHGLSLPPSLPPLKDGCLPQGPEFSLGTSPIVTEGHGLEEMEGRGHEEEASSESFPVHTGFAEQKHTLDDDAPGTRTSSGFGGGPPAEDLPYLAGAEGQQSPLHVCRVFPGSVDNATQHPSKHREDQGGLPPTSPFLQCAGAPSPLVTAVRKCFAEEMAQNSTGPQKTSSPFGATSLCSGDATSPLLETGQIIEVQTENHHSSSMPPLENEAVSDLEEPPKLLDYEERSISGVRDTLTSPQSTMQNILLAQSPSEADSALLTDGRASKNMDFLPKEEQTCLQDGKTHQKSQPETLRKEVDVPVMSRVSLTETANAGGTHPNTVQLAGVSPNSLGDALQETDSEDKTLEQKENLEGLPSYVELEESKGEGLRDASKARQLKAKKNKGLQAVCDICFFSFKSKTGLTRHKTVKHLKKNQDSLLWEPDFAPPEKAFKANKPLSKKNRKPFVTEETISSRVSEVADDRSSPRSYRGQRQEPSREIQEVVSKVLGDLNVISSATSHKLDLPGKKVKTNPTRSWTGRSDKLASRSPKEATMEGQERETNVNKLDGFAGKKPRGRVRKGKGISNPKEAPKYSLETGIHAIHSEVPLDSRDPILTTTTEGQETSSTRSPEGQASEQPSPWPPCSLTTKVPKSASGRRSSSEENGQEQAREPPLKETRPSCEGWPSSSVEGTEDVMMSVCEEQDDNIAQKGLKPKESVLENWKSTEQNSQLEHGVDFTSLQASPHDQTGFLEAASDKAVEDAFSYPVETKSCRMEELPPKTEPHRGGGTTTTMAPDLQSLCDDDATFSQLFPRNDPLARRKCTRVYGKRTKKPKPVSEVKLRPQGMPDPFTVRMASDLGDTSSFCTTREDPCEYDTISIDDTLMLSMYHGSNLGMGEVSSGSVEHMALQAEGLREDGPDLKHSSLLSFLGKKKNPTGSLLCLSSWSSPEQKADNISVDEAQLSPSQELTMGFSTAKTSPEPPDLEEEEEDAFEPRTNEDPPSPAFHTIDMEMLDAKAGVKDVCLYGVKEGHRDDHTLDLQPPPVLQGHLVKSKLEEGKAGKARGDLTLKAKDKQYKCKVCFQWFLTLGELDFHKLSHNPSPPPTCYMCVQRKFSSREQLRDHLKEKHAKNKAGLWACGMCLKEISEVWMYNEHLREHATQFARKGQAQKSVLGMPGCFGGGGGGGEEDAAVTRFLNSLMCQKPCKASRREEVGSRASACKESKGHQEGVAGQESPEVTPRVKPTTSASPKMPVAPSTPEPAPKAEGAQKVTPMHPDCKDPSRDCHHCGKQFPKPFKLQRHLVVHSLQKIYLCHRCPRFYQETQELRRHLSQEHQAAEEAEVKHTTLYACELCADVMHVIKKSFICSTCNYTFSKKEQYDRHMEKHLVGSIQTFRFRGVARPGGTVGKKDGSKKVKEEDVPMAKKKKVSHHHHQGVSIILGSPAHLDDLPDPQPHHGLPSPPPAASHRAPIPASQSSMKTEIQGADVSSLLAKTPNSPPGSPPPPPPVPLMRQCKSSGPEPRRTTALSLGLLASEGALPTENPPPFLDPPESGSNIAHTCSTGGEMGSGPKLPSAHPPEKHLKVPPGKLPFTSKVDPDVGPWVRLYLEEDPLRRMAALSRARTEAAEGETVGITSPSPGEVEIQGPHGAHLPLPVAAFPGSLPPKDQTSSPALNRMTREISFKRTTGGHALAKSDHHGLCSLDNVEVTPNPLSSKDKAHLVLLCGTSVTTQEPEGHPTRPVRGPLGSEVGADPVKHNSSDASKCQGRRMAGALAKLHPKKRKEHKSSHKGNSASRENIEGDRGRKKNAQSHDLMRKESARGHRRTNWTNIDGLALSPRKKDSQCNKPSPKLKASVASGPVRKATLDQPCFPRKVEGRPPANGNLKRKKEVLVSKTFPPLSAKDPPLPGSFNRTPRAVQGAKLPDAHNYRTAESQNNLLSQLFGQKLTSFKIPLRRDTSE